MRVARSISSRDVGQEVEPPAARSSGQSAPNLCGGGSMVVPHSTKQVVSGPVPSPVNQ